ncbi:MAG: hypothetical protein AAB492_03280 [Patescibacteria group bacterium]
MNILVFTEGTILVFLSGKNLPREEVVRLSQQAVVQRVVRNVGLLNALSLVAPKGSVYDFTSYVPIQHAVEKLTNWSKQGATIHYLTSRRTKNEIETIKTILNIYHFPDAQNILFCHKGENYKDVAKKLMPDILIEDNCESIGGTKEMTYPNMDKISKQKIHSIIIKEFEGIDHLPTSINKLNTI